MESSSKAHHDEQMARNEPVQGPIEVAGRQCQFALQQCTKSASLMRLEWAENRFAEFNLWLATTGTLAGDAASLDSRLALEWETANLVTGMLALLLACVEKCQQYASPSYPDAEEKSYDENWDNTTQVPGDVQESHGAKDIPRGFSPWSDDSPSVSETGNDTALDREQPSPLSEAKAEVEQVIDHLTRIALAIRKSGTKARLQKADRIFNPGHYQNLRKHLELIILARGSKEGNKTGYSVDVDSLTAVQERLILANLRRRNRYTYAQRHSRKLAADASNFPDGLLLTDMVQRLAIFNEVPVGLSLDTSKTNRAQSPQILFQDVGKRPQHVNLTVTSASGVAETIEPVPHRAPTPSRGAETHITATTSKIRYPKPPRLQGSLRYFQCPCCAQVLSELYRTKSMWKKHLMVDICPYTCIIEDCPRPDIIYATRNEWTRHIEKEHQQCWQCLPCSIPGSQPLIFPSIDFFLSHLSQIHSSTIDEEQYSTLVTKGARPVPAGISTCPLCDSTGPADSPQLLEHIAEHLHAFALRSLPWLTGGSENETGDEDFGDAYVTEEGYFDPDDDDESQDGSSNDSERGSYGLPSLSTDTYDSDDSNSGAPLRDDDFVDDSVVWYDPGAAADDDLSSDGQTDNQRPPSRLEVRAGRSHGPGTSKTPESHDHEQDRLSESPGTSNKQILTLEDAHPSIGPFPFSTTANQSQARPGVTFSERSASEEKFIQACMSGARSTKISRELVDPEVLAGSIDPFEVRGHYVICHRLLRPEEIQEYAKATYHLRGYIEHRRARLKRKGSWIRTASKSRERMRQWVVAWESRRIRGQELSIDPIPGQGYEGDIEDDND